MFGQRWATRPEPHWEEEGGCIWAPEEEEEEVGSRRGRRERGVQQMWAAPIAVQDIVISCFLFPQILAKWARSPTRAEQREEEAVGAESQLRLGPLSF